MINHLYPQANKQIPRIDGDVEATRKIDCQLIESDHLSRGQADSGAEHLTCPPLINECNTSSLATGTLLTNSLLTNSLPTNSLPTNSLPTNSLPMNSLPMNHAESADSDSKASSWQTLMADAITDIDELLQLLNLSSLRSALYVPKDFTLRVPHGFVAKMVKGDSNDPLLRQVLPSVHEKSSVTGYSTDPLAETQYNPTTGLLHKYRSRVLVTVTGACAIHCRYCFRQHFDYQTNIAKNNQLADIQSYIMNHSDINEVILSGGDPLSVSNRRLFKWLDALEALPQIQIIRIHTRLPIVIPERLDSELLNRLASSRCQIVMVVHTNHANEIDKNTGEALLRLKSGGITVLNQTVLLAGINDSVDAQVDLSHKLFEFGVAPYYLHLLDKVAGAAHFDTHKQQAVALYWQLLERLPGYLIPKLVEELPNKPYKTPVNIYTKNL